jgi:hypothetical protein
MFYVEPDYSAYLTRAETHMHAIYPAMADRQYKEAAQHAYQSVSELMGFLMWVTTERGKG